MSETESEIDLVAESEREKYELVWKDPSYRNYVPGLIRVEDAWEEFNPQPGQSLCDWGCGTGRAAQWFIERGLKVVGVDIAANACDAPIHVIVANMWDMPNVGVWDYGFCVDVMEHIPPQKVTGVLKSIRQRTRKRAYFAIAMFDDVFGETIGQQLHLSVRPIPWWAGGFEKAGWRRFSFELKGKHLIVVADQ